MTDNLKTLYMEVVYNVTISLWRFLLLLLMLVFKSILKTLDFLNSCFPSIFCQNTFVFLDGHALLISMHFILESFLRTEFSLTQ